MSPELLLLSLKQSKPEKDLSLVQLVAYVPDDQ